MENACGFLLLRIIIAGALLFPVYQALAEEPEEERWNAYGQFTYIWHQKESFPAAYTNLNGSTNSLVPDRERSYTTTATAFLGLRAWKDAELYAVPEVISELPLSGLHGLGGSIQNAELEKNGKRSPTLYRSRLFLRQTWGFGGGFHSGGIGTDAASRVGGQPPLRFDRRQSGDHRHIRQKCLCR